MLSLIKIDLFERYSCIEREGETDLLSADSLPGYLQYPGLSQYEDRIQELLPSFAHECRGPRIGACSAAFSGVLEVDEARLKSVSVWDSGITGSSFTSCATASAPWGESALEVCFKSLYCFGRCRVGLVRVQLHSSE